MRIRLPFNGELIIRRRPAPLVFTPEIRQWFEDYCRLIMGRD